MPTPYQWMSWLPPFLCILACSTVVQSSLVLPSLTIDVSLTPVFFHSDVTLPHWGLKSSLDWYTLKSNLTYLEVDEHDTLYRLLFLQRHGEGTHNVAEAQYGSKAWDQQWSKVNCNAKFCWGPDANLTQHGREQAKLARTTWTQEFDNGLDYPHARYTSSLSRAIETAELVLGSQTTVEDFYVFEDLREVYGVHTCDRRSTRSYLSRRFHNIKFESGFSEEDRLWRKQEREPRSHTQQRALRALGSIFSRECNGADKHGRVLSITSHSGLLMILLEAIGHKVDSIPLAGVVPLVVAIKCHQRVPANHGIL